MEIGEGTGKIYVGIPRERFYFPEFVDNRDRIMTSLGEAGLFCGYFQAGGHRVDRNRDRIVQSFFEHKDNPEWLLMLDSDMEHIHNIGQRLLAYKKPIVGALYFHRGEHHDPFAFMKCEDDVDEFGRTEPRWTPMRDETYDFLQRHGIPMKDGAIAIDEIDDGLREVDAVATGAMLIHRSVLETMKGPWFEYESGGTSEDLMFCLKAKELGFPIFCDFSTISGHYALAAMGHAQFRLTYEGRGLNYTLYSPNEAIKMISEFFEKPEKEAKKLYEEGSASTFGEYWKTLEVKGDDAERATYRAPNSGLPYVIELLHWNAVPDFGMLRRGYIGLRNKNIIEIGSGIGTMALQLCIQRNNVLAVEVNPVLQKFIDYRYKKAQKEIRTKMGDFEVVGDEWLSDTRKFQAAFAIDVFEHMPFDDLVTTIHALGNMLIPGGKLFYHANWGQQDLYPMHHDHSEMWQELLKNTGFYSITPFEALRI